MTESVARTCPDFHICRNGATCVESTTEAGRFYCDCDQINSISNSYAGVSCEHKATVFCNNLNQVSYTSFCTNSGTCIQNVAVNGVHKGCQCPASYTGEFCEFLVGQQLPDHLSNEISTTSSSAANSSSGSSAGLIAVVVVSIALVVSITLAVASYFALKIAKVEKEEKEVVAQDLDSPNKNNHHDLALDADGGILQDAVKSVHTSSTTDDDVDDERPLDPAFSIDSPVTDSRTGIV